MLVKLIERLTNVTIIAVGGDDFDFETRRPRKVAAPILEFTRGHTPQVQAQRIAPLCFSCLAFDWIPDAASCRLELCRQG